MAPRIKWSGPKKALLLKQEPDLEDDLRKDPTYNPKSMRLSRVRGSRSRVTKRSRITKTLQIKRELQSPALNDIDKAAANVGHRRKIKDVDEVEVTFKDNGIQYEMRFLARPRDSVGQLMKLWTARRRGLSEPRFFLGGERILEHDSTLEDLSIEDGDTIDVFYEVTGG